ncbi:MAG TPA: FKBP-type peptidyl-prolyl cis-trans isomerase [Opitutaceae bacterium]|nr:FKBP-type peptidyl-prolyl cis-trans isomerase [Opitutaceae bacterium]
MRNLKIGIIGRVLACSAGLLLAARAESQQATPAAPTPAPVYPLTAYSSFGSSLALSGHFADLGWSEEQVNAFLQGFKSAVQGKAVPMDDSARQLAADMGKRISEITASGQLQEAEAADPKVRLKTYFREMGKRLGLQVSDDGLGYNVQAGRNGIRPRMGDTVVFTVKATQADGATTIPVLSAEHLKVKFSGMMPALMEGLQMMTVGSHAVFVIPPALSFGDGQWPDGVPQGSPLVYWVTLEDVAAAPSAR